MDVIERNEKKNASSATTESLHDKEAKVAMIVVAVLVVQTSGAVKLHPAFGVESTRPVTTRHSGGV